jgi:hypothetical protein
MSPTAVQLEKKFGRSDARASESSTSRSLVKQSVFDALSETFDECNAPGWNGSAARAVSNQTFENARRFLSILPSSVPVPDVMAEPDGEIAFEWRAANKSVFSVSVGEADTIAFAGLFGYGSKQHGTEPFDDTIPPVVLNAIRRVFHGTVSESSR